MRFSFGPFLNSSVTHALVEARYELGFATLRRTRCKRQDPIVLVEQARKELMAETVPTYSPPAPAIGRVSADDRQSERAAGGPPRGPSPAAGDTALETTSHPPFE